MSYLVIVESPAKASTIKGYLGPKYKVLASKGHIRDIAKLYTLAEVLRREGKLSALPQYQNMILRPEVTEAGMAEASNSARSASVESSDAFARKLPGKPRPFK